LPEPGVEIPQVLDTALTLVREGQGNAARLVATLLDENGVAVTGASIDFLGDGSALGVATTDASGVATIPLEGRYRGGKHAFEALFGGNDSYTGSSGSTS
jgi:hypothetical protein